MENRTLEITLQYANDLNKVNLITKMDVYAVVSISGGDNKANQRTKSPVDHDGDANPKWNFPMKFTVDEAALHQNRLTLDIMLVCERALGDKDVGEVNVPLKELFDSAVNGGVAEGKKFVSYQVRKPGGQPKGQLNFAYKFSNQSAAVAPPSEAAPQQFPAMAYPVGNSSMYPPIAPGGYPPPPSSYPVVEGGGGLYPPPAPYPVASEHYPSHPLYPVESGGGHYPPMAPYPVSAEGGHYPPAVPYGGYPPPPPPPHIHEYGYPPPPGNYSYPPQSGYGFQPQQQQGYGYPPPPQGYGYQPQSGYGYNPAGAGAVQKPHKKNNKFGAGAMGLGAGLLGGAIGGLLVGDIISDAVDFDCGGFDF